MNSWDNCIEAPQKLGKLLIRHTSKIEVCSSEMGLILYPCPQTSVGQFEMVPLFASRSFPQISHVTIDVEPPSSMVLFSEAMAGQSPMSIKDLLPVFAKEAIDETLVC
jgi:hypothetical protein